MIGRHRFEASIVFKNKGSLRTFYDATLYCWGTLLYVQRRGGCDSWGSGGVRSSGISMTIGRLLFCNATRSTFMVAVPQWMLKCHI